MEYRVVVGFKVKPRNLPSWLSYTEEAREGFVRDRMENAATRGLNGSIFEGSRIVSVLEVE